MDAQVFKIIIGAALITEIIVSVILYRIKSLTKFHAYFYLFGTISILECFSFLCFDQKIFSVEHDALFYLIELCIFSGIQILLFIALFLYRRFLKKDDQK